MTTTELLSIASENLRDSMDQLQVIAERPDYINGSTKEIAELFERISNQFTLCFTLKNAIQDLTRP